MIRILFLLGIPFLSTSCATIMHGTKQLISIVTWPAGALVSHGNVTVTTPATLNLDRKCDHTLTVTKPGYEPQVVHVTRTSNGSFAQIILPGGLIGYGIDVMNGAQYDLKPTKVDVTLRREPFWKTILRPRKTLKDRILPGTTLN